MTKIKEQYSDLSKEIGKEPAHKMLENTGDIVKKVVKKGRPRSLANNTNDNKPNKPLSPRNRRSLK